MVLDSNEGTKVPSVPKGRAFIQSGGVGRHAQGIFTAECGCYRSMVEEAAENRR